MNFSPLMHVIRRLGTPRPPFVVVVLSIAVCLLASAVATPSASAASFTVTGSGDDVDATPGDGVCATPSGDCTLRAAVMETNSFPGWDKIIVTGAGARLTVAGPFEDAAATGDLDVTDSLTLLGRGTRVAVVGARGFDDRLFDVDPARTGITVRMLGLTIAHGDAFGSGGGIENHDSASLTLLNVTLRANRVSGAIANLGGGIYNDGALVVQNSRVTSNVTSGNPFSVGGGIANAGKLEIGDSSIAGNRAEAEGGGIYNGAPATTSITASTISSNNAAKGGGLWNRGDLKMENATISANDAAAWGGGLDNNLGTAMLTHATVAANSAGVFGAGIYDTGGGGLVELRNTIVAGATLPTGQDCGGTINSGGGNLDGGTSCAFSLPTDISNVSPQLGPLAPNGGPTVTHALMAGSPAIDAAVTATCSARDQRGVARPQGSGCDIGAYEAP